MVKNLLVNSKYFLFFYSYLGYRIFLVIFLSFLVGLLDGFGIALFIPLFEVAANGDIMQAKNSLGELDFLVEFMVKFDLDLTINFVLVFMTSVFIFKGIFKFIENYYKVSLQVLFVKKLRYQMIEGINDLEFEKFLKLDAGKIQNTLSGEVYKITSAFIAYFNTIQFLVMLIVYIVLAFLTNFNFALLVSIGGFLSNFIYKFLFKLTEKVSVDITGLSHKFQSFLIQAVLYFKYLKATGTISSYKKKLANVVDNIEASQKKMGMYNAILNSTREPIIIIIVVLVIIIQLYLFDDPLATIILSLIFFYRAMNYIMNVQSAWQQFISNYGGIQAGNEILEDFSNGKEIYANKTLALDSFDLKFENVSFFYDSPSEKVLKDISLTIKNHSTNAFVGPSGGGKTTIVNLLVGLLNPKGGKVSINGIDRSQIDLRKFRSQVGYITQEHVIFNDSIFNNITFWAEVNEENMSRVMEIIEMVNLKSFVADLPDGIHTFLGDSGKNLSGGQKQRISIARELFKNVKLLVFDEATSALDSSSEKIIQENIDSLRGKYTIIIIAHRLSTVKDVENIFYIENGEIKGSGTFDEMVASNDDFKAMINLQKF
ncbi:ABC transporter ATP-binding protein [Algoriphagus hitonicola]|uniref:Multidrug resistance-like ATP-binding protein MdlB n=1 Tax=Algoriphagus hitonicola TaxID=435880 RepID=A0A1I2X4G2_9BACT|nr:ABC transporter ATP-binding protein [Algoriphagus hitonicola]SFH08312.1 ATP-binding cassette, subfamily B, MsbA [Algoriphagus hitonicola]